MTDRCGCRFCSVIPPYMLTEAAKRTRDDRTRARLLAQVSHDATLLMRRTLVAAGELDARSGLDPAGVYDAHGRSDLPGGLVWTTGQSPSADTATREASDGHAAVWTFWNDFAGLDLPMPATVHYDDDDHIPGYDNAFWNGEQMVFGDGDGSLFNRFTIALDVIGHERGHGIIGDRLPYWSSSNPGGPQPGTLNEHGADAFGLFVDQRQRGQTVGEATWLIGQGLLAYDPNAALRSAKAPGTAYDTPDLGKDPQPADLDGFIRTRTDQGGVHLNSSIGNRALYLAACNLGADKHVWDEGQVARIWYQVLTGRYSPQIGFLDFAKLTIKKAKKLYGREAEQAVTEAWAAVKVVRAKGDVAA